MVKQPGCVPFRHNSTGQNNKTGYRLPRLQSDAPPFVEPVPGGPLTQPLPDIENARGRGTGELRANSKSDWGQCTTSRSNLAQRFQDTPLNLYPILQPISNHPDRDIQTVFDSLGCAWLAPDCLKTVCDVETV